MALAALIAPFPWANYSRKLTQQIERPTSYGWFTKEETEERGLRLAVGEDGDAETGNKVCLYFLVDKDDGTIIDAKFQAFGQSALIGAADTACFLLVGKNYDQAKRMTADLIDRSVRDRADVPAFPRETYPHLNLVLGAIEEACAKCSDLPFASTHAAPPVPESADVETSHYPGWMELPLKRKIAAIEEVLDKDVRPYIALDAGGIEVLNLLNDKEVVIAYQGACTSCYSSIGSTLSYIQQTLRNKIHPDITVTPDLIFNE